MPYCYRLYGLTLCCAFPLPELAAVALPEQDSGDITVRCAAHDLPPDVAATQDYLLHYTPDEALFFYPQVGSYTVRDGRTITIDPLPGSSEDMLRPLLLGSILGMALSQRGYLVLHASAVVCPAGACGIMGWKGAGKSVAAASLAQHGFPLLSDDITALADSRDAGGAPLALPGVAQVRLWPDAVTALGDAANDLPLVHPAIDKRYWSAPHALAAEPVPLACLYVLDDGPAPAITPLPPEQRFVEVLRHTYLSRWSKTTAAAAQHLPQIAQLAAQVPVYHLTRPRDFAALPAVMQLVAQHQTER